MASRPALISAVQQTLDTEPQYIDAPLSIAAAFLVLTVRDDEASLSKVRSVLGSTDDLIKNITIRDISRTFTCNVGIAHRVWASLTGKPAPKELTPFKEIKGAQHTAVSTPGERPLESERCHRPGESRTVWSRQDRPGDGPQRGSPPIDCFLGIGWRCVCHRFHPRRSSRSETA